MSPTLAPPSVELQLDFVVIGLVLGFVAIRIWQAKPVLPIDRPAVEQALEFLFCAFPSFVISWCSVMIGFLALDLRSHLREPIIRAVMVVAFVIGAFVALAAFVVGLAVISVRRPRLLVPPHMRTSRAADSDRTEPGSEPADQ